MFKFDVYFLNIVVINYFKLGPSIIGSELLIRNSL